MEACVYGAHGYRVALTVDAPRTAYAGYVREAELPWYVLGVRIYIPWLRRFICIDALSPFGAGGLNRYTYCVGDPINHIDPSGHSAWKFLGSLLGRIGGTIGKGMDMVAQATPTTALTTIGAVADVVAVGTTIGAVTAGALDDESAAGILGWVATGSGLGGIGLGIAGQVVGKSHGATGQIGRRLSNTSLPGSDAGEPQVLGSINPAGVRAKARVFLSPDRVVTEFSGRGLRNLPALKGRAARTENGTRFALRPNPQFWPTKEGGMVIGFDTKVTNRHVRPMVRTLAEGNPNQTFNVFAGVHGDVFGRNWKPTGDGGFEYNPGKNNRRLVPEVAAALEADFFDLGNVNVIDMSKMRASTFENHLRSDAVNVLSFCWSYGDEKFNGVRRSVDGEATSVFVYRARLAQI